LNLPFYMDVHVPRAVTTALRLRGIDVLTAQEDGSAELDDGRLLRRATELGLILVTQDADLLREAALLLSEHAEFCGVVYAHQLRVTIGQPLEELDLIARATFREEWSGRIEFLPIRMTRRGRM
jgi:predicted nuclease of predicted toxin-antitoxin system